MRILIILIALVLLSCNEKQEREKKAEQAVQQKLKELFFDWSKKEITNKHLWAKDSCYPDWIMRHDFEGTLEDMWGLPDSSSFNYSYADVNEDGKTDQLVTFMPSQCDGGNASMWVQIEVLAISDKDQYKIETSMGDGIFSAAGQGASGFYFYDSIGVNKIYATYFNFGERDGHCCPSIVKNVVFDYKTRKVIHTGPNVSKQYNGQ